jgi:hypothetical protein
METGLATEASAAELTVGELPEMELPAAECSCLPHDASRSAAAQRISERVDVRGRICVRAIVIRDRDKSAMRRMEGVARYMATPSLYGGDQLFLKLVQPAIQLVPPGWKAPM